MKFLLFLLLSLPLFGKQSERYYQEKFAREIGEQVEVVMKNGTRCDILTAAHAIEVDFAKKWAEAIWQSLNYAMHTGRLVETKTQTIEIPIEVNEWLTRGWCGGCLISQHD